MSGGVLEALSRLVEGSRSLRLESGEPLRRLEEIDRVAVVGPTCAGKSKVIEAIRAAAAESGGRIVVPVRYLTRPERDNESPGENVHVSSAEFERLIEAGDIGLHWSRPLEGSRVERYGFRVTAPELLPVYSGNNALYGNAASIRPAGGLKRALFVGVEAPEEVREARLRARSPDLCASNPLEVAHRLADVTKNMFPHVHVVVSNHGLLEPAALAEAVELVKGVERLSRRR